MRPSDHSALWAKKIENNLFFETIQEPLAKGEKVWITARGNSMYPLVRSDIDAVLLQPTDPNRAQVGQVLLAKVGERYIMHRVEKILGEQITLRGDGNPYQREQCRRASLIAEMVAVKRPNGRVYDKNSTLWKRVQAYWPANGHLRRLILALLRRIIPKQFGAQRPGRQHLAAPTA